MTQFVDRSSFASSIQSRVDDVLTPAHAAFLRMHAGLLHSFMTELARPVFDASVARAAVTFDRNGRCFMFRINPVFWASIGFIRQCFVLSHEILHILLKHIEREQALIDLVKGENGPYQLLDNDTLNILQDIEINEVLVTPAYGFDRKTIELADGMCFVDTVFPEDIRVAENLPLNESFEFYAHIWMKYHEHLDVEALSQLLLETHFSPGNPNETGPDGPDVPAGCSSDSEPSSWEAAMEAQQVVQGFLGDSIGTEDLINNTGRGPAGGYGTGSFGDYTIELAPARSLDDVFETTLRAAHKRSEQREAKRSWSQPNRRLYSLMQHLDPSVSLPGIRSTPIKIDEKLKILVYMDVSGSCFDYIKKMMTLIKNLPEEKYELETFIFAGSVASVDLEKPRFFSGGTEIKKVYAHAKSRIAEKKVDGVFVLTDGEFEDCHSKSGIDFKNWAWYLVPSYMTTALPTQGTVHRVKEFDYA
jgi:hypothetical protein